MEADDIDELFIRLCELYNLYKKYKNNKKQRRYRIRPINKNWATAGCQLRTFQLMRTKEPEQWFLQTRMPPHIFDMLLKLVSKSLWKPKQRIGPEERLSLALLYLSQGLSMQSISGSYKLGKETVRKIVFETCEVIWRLLSPVYVSEPTESQYQDIAKDFYNIWNIPNCVGAIDGKHVAIKCPANSNAMFYNYKKFYSIVLMAACDAKYTFTAVSIGSFGSQSDGGIFQLSPFGQALMQNTLPLPPPQPLSSVATESFPHFFIGDAAFPLRTNLMRPYPGSNLTRTKRIFNYRLSHARRVIENSFGILTARWRVLRTTIECCPESCEKIVLACIALHNFIMLNDQNRWYCPENYVDQVKAGNVVHLGEWRREIENDRSLLAMRSAVRRGPATAFNLRDKLANYFINEGYLPFQDNIDHNIGEP
ncbi:putative nuclease HARBI1 [Rhagoletis pomonella]|uniref:putative nuclease HARBI1 n=1 Tax=Rhagoletis pomonella TaxID=28610 RepID=UPI0017839642|nr:putative nuclease HARBI1 [Rhagoletis pomonella]